jgi:hypothetical protein
MLNKLVVALYNANADEDIQNFCVFVKRLLTETFKVNYSLSDLDGNLQFDILHINPFYLRRIQEEIHDKWKSTPFSHQGKPKKMESRICGTYPDGTISYTDCQIKSIRE